MDFDAFIAELREGGRQHYGWLAPDNRVFPCGLHNHARALAEAGFQPDWAERRILPQQAALACAHDEHVDTGAQWHDYQYDDMDNEVADESRLFIQQAYREGWIRLGMGTWGHPPTLDAEGMRSVLNAKRGLLSDAALTFGREYRDRAFGRSISGKFMLEAGDLQTWPVEFQERCREFFGGSIPALLEVDWHTLVDQERTKTVAAQQAVQRGVEQVGWVMRSAVPDTDHLPWLNSDISPPIPRHLPVLRNGIEAAIAPFHGPVVIPEGRWSAEEHGFVPGQDAANTEDEDAVPGYR